MLFGDFKKAIRANVFPTGEAANLVAAHNKMFVDGLVDLQTVVECLQQDHTDLYPQCSTFYDCQMTVFPAPRGIIKSVSTIDKVGASESGTITASKVDNIITSSAPYFNAGMVGELIVFPDGQSFVISGFLSSTQIMVQLPQVGVPGSDVSVISGGAP